MQKVTLKLRGIEQLLEGEVQSSEVIDIQGIDYQIESLPVDVPVNGTVYGALLNYQGAYDKLKPAMEEAPYQHPPKAPVLYIKPKNTFISSGQPIPLPENETGLEMGAALAIVIGKTATKVSEENALDYVLGYTIANDVSIPHENVHRPDVKQKARDGFCPIGLWITSSDSIENPNELHIKVFVNGELKQVGSTKDMIFSIPELIEYLSSFMTLHENDVILTGTPKGSVDTKVGDEVVTEIEGIGRLMNTIITEA